MQRDKQVPDFYYAAALFFKTLVDGLYCESNLWEEQILLIKAASQEDALEAAREIGEKQESAYLNSAGERIEWKFVKVERVCEIEGMGHGAELFSRFLRGSEAASLLTPFDDTE